MIMIENDIIDGSLALLQDLLVKWTKSIPSNTYELGEARSKELPEIS